MQGSPAFGAERFARHRLATMPERIKLGQPLLETQGHIGYRGDDDTPVLDRYAYPLIGMQTRSARHRDRKADTQIVAPSLDVQDRFSHGETFV